MENSKYPSKKAKDDGNYRHSDSKFSQCLDHNSVIDMVESIILCQVEHNHPVYQVLPKQS